MSPAEQIEFVKSFKDRQYFSYSGWEQRGLGPSDDFISESLHNGFQTTASELIDAINDQASTRRLRRLLIDCMKDCRRLDLDTEEKEYAADLFAQLAFIIGVDVRYQLNSFVYHPLLLFILWLIKPFPKAPSVRIVSDLCSSCEQPLLFGVPDIESIDMPYWIVLKCSRCQHFFILDEKLGAGHFSMTNCEVVEFISKDEFSIEQAQARLEQIRYFRK